MDELLTHETQVSSYLVPISLAVSLLLFAVKENVKQAIRADSQSATVQLLLKKRITWCYKELNYIFLPCSAGGKIAVGGGWIKKELAVTFVEDVSRMVLLENNNESFVDTKGEHLN